MPWWQLAMFGHSSYLWSEFLWLSRETVNVQMAIAVKSAYLIFENMMTAQLFAALSCAWCLHCCCCAMQLFPPFLNQPHNRRVLFLRLNQPENCAKPRDWRNWTKGVRASTCWVGMRSFPVVTPAAGDIASCPDRQRIPPRSTGDIKRLCFHRRRPCKTNTWCRLPGTFWRSIKTSKLTNSVRSLGDWQQGHESNPFFFLFFFSFLQILASRVWTAWDQNARGKTRVVFESKDNIFGNKYTHL